MRRLFPIFLVVIAIAIFVFYINPVYSGSIATARTEIANDNQALSQLASFSTKENKLIDERNQIPANDLAIVSKLLPPSVNNVQTILDLDNLASASGVELDSVNVANPSGGSADGFVAGVPGDQSLGSVDLSLSASGTYGSFQKFLSGIEHSARLLDVENLGIKGSTSGVYTYSMTLRLYWIH